MVYTKLAPRRQQFHVAPAMQQPNSAVSIPLRWILKIRAIEGSSHSLRITCDMSAVSLLDGREQLYTKAMNNNTATAPEFHMHVHKVSPRSLSLSPALLASVGLPEVPEPPHLVWHSAWERKRLALPLQPP